MDLDKYRKLSGLKVSDSQALRVNAAIARTQVMLETMLGFTLDPDDVTENLYNETGKTQLECACSDVDAENLLDPDDVEGAYRLYGYNDKDKFFHVDPFSTLHKLKLVKGNVTIKTFEDDEFRVVRKQGGLLKYIEVKCDWCLCRCTCTDCVQVAVDADWLWQLDDDDHSTIPDDLLTVWSDMVTYYANPKKDLRSETLDSHSYTKQAVKLPEDEPYANKVIRKYAGPYGSRNPVKVV